MKSMTPLRYLDFGLAIASLIYGVATISWPWILGGVLGLALAWVNPGQRIKAFLLTRVRRPAAREIAPASGFPAPPTIPYVQPRDRGVAAASESSR